MLEPQKSAPLSPARKGHEVNYMMNSKFLTIGLMASMLLLAGCTNLQKANTDEGEPLETGLVDGDEASPANETADKTYSVPSSSDLPENPTVQYASPGDMYVTVVFSPSSSSGASPISEYKIYKSISRDEVGVVAGVVNGSEKTTDGQSLKWTDKEVGVGGVYYYRVSAVNSQGESDPARGGMVWSSTYSTSRMMPSPSEDGGYEIINLACGCWSEFYKMPVNPSLVRHVNTFGVPYVICPSSAPGSLGFDRGCMHYGQEYLRAHKDPQNGRAAWEEVSFPPEENFQIKLDYPGTALITTAPYNKG